MKIISMKYITIFASILFLQACGSDDDTSPVTPVNQQPSTTIVDVASSDGNFTTLVAALTATGLDATLADPTQKFTVFAPTDSAFALLGQSTIDALLADTDTLADILTYHVYQGEVDAAAAIGLAGQVVGMVNGDNIGLSLNGDSLLVNTATVIQTDIMTDNGIIHVIDAVLMPPANSAQPTANIVETAVAAGSFTTLVAALQATDLDTVLADPNASYTVFAPTDAAFEMIGAETIATLLDNTDVLSNILLQHVVEGAVPAVNAYTLNGQMATTASGAMIPITIDASQDQLLFGGAKIITQDIHTTNGIIHVIDMVVVGDVEIPAPSNTLVDVAVDAGSFNTLVAALQATGLDTVLADTSTDFTVFAPTDAAFALLGEETIAALLNDTETLKDILLYHVLAGSKVMQDGAVTVAQSDSNKVTMANGTDVALSLSQGQLFINKSRVSAADIMAENGVIHVVNQVILPPTMKNMPTMSIVDVAVADPNFSTLVTALSTANLVDVLADETKMYTVFAPTNAAFAKINSDSLNGLLADNDALTGVLLQHVVADAEIGVVDAYAANGKSVNTAIDDDVSINIIDYTLFENDENAEVAYHAEQQMLIGGMGTAMADFTLYVFDADLGTTGSVCNDTCAENWPPVIVNDGAINDLMGLSVVMRDDGTMQAAFQGRPLYFFAGDTEVGQTNGNGLNNVWWTVNQEQVSLNIQGANVTTSNIYTTNGVIHVIDSVITETLN